MKTPPPDEAEKVFRLRCMSKRGDPITAEQMKYCEQMMKKYPKWYSSLSEKVFEATKPYGAR